ncbi:glycosyltransferase family 2 protein [Pontibacter harenae]|uniref:glycosyltransferase family 2 protein n=1 Tax=Pontibacter harenae TaxID=2894083 RepID=UPI001E2F6622|nr:glycosyltransferase [Pontibacter harenae]MCC9167205.1 glycosyltransferase [Pontibacter harenae]
MKIGLLVTNYNTWEMTSQCIENCIKYADSPIDQFVVVDDCSNEPFENHFGEQISLSCNQTNLGLIRSLNKGLEILDTDLVLIFDSDAWPLENFTNDVKEYFSNNKEIGIASFNLLDSEGKPSVSFEAEPSILSLVLGQKLYAHYQRIFSKFPKSFTVYTCAMVVRKKVLEEIGSFDENFDWLELDHDICMRATRRGWKIGIIPTKVFHKGSGTPQKVSHRVVRFYKNRWYLLSKFNKIRFAKSMARVIRWRLTIEYLVLHVFGSYLFKDKEVINDKLHSRRELLQFFSTSI